MRSILFVFVALAMVNGCDDGGGADVSPTPGDVTDAPVETATPEPTQAPVVVYRLTSELTTEEVEAMYTIEEYPDVLTRLDAVTQASVAQGGALLMVEFVDAELNGAPIEGLGALYFNSWVFVTATAIMEGTYRDSDLPCAVQYVRQEP